MASSWLNPLDRLYIQKAVRAKRNTATLDDGRTVIIQPSELKPSHLIIQVKDQLVPLSVIARETILMPGWSIAP